jgi:hypothetical protein
VPGQRASRFVLRATSHPGSARVFGMAVHVDGHRLLGATATRLFYWQTARASDHGKLDDRTERECEARIAAPIAARLAAPIAASLRRIGPDARLA